MLNNQGNVNYGIFLPLLNVYGDQKTIDCFTQEAMFDGWLKAESALARAEAEESIIPVEMAEKIEQAAHISSLDLKDFWEETRNVGYPIIPLVNRLAEVAGEAGKYVHWGATTQDIMDTGLILQIKSVLNRLEQLLTDLGNACATLCEQHAETIQAGRTHGQQAVPITFGFKVSVWLEEIQRHYLRLQEVKKRLLVGQLSGAAGTLATLGEKAPFVRKRYCNLLGLNEPQGPWHVARDIIVEFSNMEATISGTVQKIAKEIANLASTEIGEVFEF
ncbi:lyase family protein [Lentibacillus amyloliquefaciens]|uniref:lyase family protein n=1 Tax=Lentibacillus amyloliquefaciens TaxID=1472767 RepID=UPI0009EAA3E8|nr:lyase family protein [Lentibacillus amyloliquefaciens]